MPYTSIKSAEAAKFPTAIDDVTLTLAQINRLAKLYDAINKNGGADEPMAVAITQWKKEHQKSDDDWIRAEIFGAEMPPSSFDPETYIVKAIKVGTVAHNILGEPFTATEEWLHAHADNWTGGKLIANHYGAGSPAHADIERSWFDGEFELMQLTNMNPDTERRMNNGEHTGFSFDMVGSLDNPDDMKGTNLSILFYPHNPACSVEDGCGLMAETPQNETESQSHNLTTEDIQKLTGSEYMGEGKPYTEAEIAKLVEDSAKLATFEAEAKTNESTVNALKAEIDARNETISELTNTADTMFTAETVEEKVEEAKKTMFSAEDVEAAKKEAIELAIVAEKERVDSIAAELAVVNQMFPDGLAEDFRAEIVTMIKDGKSHEAFVKLGDVDFKKFEARMPTGGDNVAGEGSDVPTNGFTVGDCKGV